MLIHSLLWVWVALRGICTPHCAPRPPANMVTQKQAASIFQLFQFNTNKALPTVAMAGSRETWESQTAFHCRSPGVIPHFCSRIISHNSHMTLPTCKGSWEKQSSMCLGEEENEILLNTSDVYVIICIIYISYTGAEIAIWKQNHLFQMGSQGP